MARKKLTEGLKKLRAKLEIDLNQLREGLPNKSDLFYSIAVVEFTRLLLLKASFSEVLLRAVDTLVARALGAYLPFALLADPKDFTWSEFRDTRHATVWIRWRLVRPLKKKFASLGMEASLLRRLASAYAGSDTETSTREILRRERLILKFMMVLRYTWEYEPSLKAVPVLPGLVGIEEGRRRVAEEITLLYHLKKTEGALRGFKKAKRTKPTFANLDSIVRRAHRLIERVKRIRQLGFQIQKDRERRYREALQHRDVLDLDHGFEPYLYGLLWVLGYGEVSDAKRKTYHFYRDPFWLAHAIQNPMRSLRMRRKLQSKTRDAIQSRYHKSMAEWHAWRDGLIAEMGDTSGQSPPDGNPNARPGSSAST